MRNNRRKNAETEEQVMPETNETPNTENTETSETAGSPTTPKRRGAVPTMPLCVVYWLDGRCIAAVLSPRGETYEARGKGKGTAMGMLIDSGFVLGPLHNDPPAWVGDQKRIPSEARVEGFANIQGFPLPAQD